mgnify:CR=1 FL=1
MDDLKRYEELGGKIYYRSYVQQIVDTKDKKEVILKDGTKYFAKKVICNLSERYVYKDLIKDASELLSDDPLLFLINSYTTGLSKTVLEDILYLRINNKYKGLISSDELGLSVKDSNLILPCGIYARWENKL